MLKSIYIAKLAVDPNYANDNVSLYIFRACVFVIWTPPFIGDRLKHNDEMYSCIWEPSETVQKTNMSCVKDIILSDIC
jgi:hypothetical protein